MTRTQILNRDGSPTPYFWSEGDGSEPTRKRVYKQTRRGITWMRGVLFDSVKKRMRRRPEG